MASGGSAPPADVVAVYVSSTAVSLGSERQQLGEVPERTELAKHGFDPSAPEPPMLSLAAALPASPAVAVYLERSLPYRALVDIAETLRARGAGTMFLMTHQRHAGGDRTRALRVGLAAEGPPEALTIELDPNGYAIRRGPVVLGCRGVPPAEAISLPLKDKTYDYAGLRQCVLSTADRGRRLRLSADPRTSYHNLISTLDMLERDERGAPLFDTISLCKPNSLP